MSRDAVELRRLIEDDREVLFSIAQDPASNEMAKVYPRSRASFEAHWDRIRTDPDVVARAILRGGEVVGSINSFVVDGRTQVGYWIDRAHWGRGIATRALGLFLDEVRARPLTAIVASENGGSRRVLERCGFVKVGERESPETERYMACVEVEYRLE